MEKFLIKEVIAPICIIGGSIVLYAILSKIIRRIFKINSKTLDKKQKTMLSLLNNILKYTLAAIAIIAILNIYGINTKAILASLGIISLVIGLALQDVLKDLLSGITILFENQFHIGDTVTIGNFKGEVVGFGLKTTKLKSYNGEIKFISNRNIIEVINHTLSNSVAVVDISISYDSDLKKVEDMLNELCQELSKTLPNLKGEVQLLGINQLSDKGVEFRITAETKSLQNGGVEREIRKQVKLACDKNKITMAHVQVVV